MYIKKIKKIYLNNLPKHKRTINWQKSIKQKVNFVYDNIKGEVEIIDYYRKNRRSFLKIRYKNNTYDIDTGSFRECRFGKMLGKVTNEFKIKIGTRFKDKKRDITIIDKEYREKIRSDGKKQYLRWYKYKCNKCGFKDWKVENGLLKGDGCSCCCSNPRIPVLGINTIWDTDRWMCDLGVSEEDAKTHTKSSNQKINVACPDCGRSKDIPINKINYYHSIFCKCSDKISYPNKFCNSLLTQLQINFIPEYSPKWISPKRYDFYFKLNNKEYIVEMDGDWHNKDNRMSGQTAKESKLIDKYKDKLAKEHDIEVIRIDCKESDLEYIKDKILKSRINKLFNLSKIDWLKCEEFALNNLVKKVCKIKKDNPDYTTKQISKIINLNYQTITRYLKKGTKIGWCNYDPKEESIKSKKIGSKPVEIFKNNKLLGNFPSCAELQRQSEKLFGIKLFSSRISANCLRKCKNYKGFTFKYIN